MDTLNDGDVMADGRLFTKTHEWVLRSGTTATVGISAHAQDSLGDITFVELPKAGVMVSKGKECGVIESVKAASDLFAPVGGKVIEVNADLETAPESINSDPYGAGWLFRIDTLADADFDGLMDETAYAAFLESEA